MKNFNFYSHTIKGRRKNNEDSCLAKRLNADNILLAVADGMGGAAAGEVASKIAIEVLQEHINSKLNELSEKSDFKKIFSESYRKIQESIKRKIQEIPEYQGMGTTLCAVWIYKNQYVWANLGDSRIYFLDDKIIKQITKDHTYVQDFKDKHGTEVPKEIAQQYGNYIMRSLDGGKDEPDIFPLNKPYETLTKNSAFLLCSDGLIPDKLENTGTHLHQIFLAHRTLKTATDALMKFAFDKGSTDNITVVLGEFGKVKRNSGKQKKSKIISTILIGLLGIAIAGVIWLEPAVLSNKWNDLKQKINMVTQNTSKVNSNGNDIPQKTINAKYEKFEPFLDLNVNDEFNLLNPEHLRFNPYNIPSTDDIQDYYLYIKNKKIEPIKIETKQEGSTNYFLVTKELGLEEGKYTATIMVRTIKGEEIVGEDFVTFKIIEGKEKK